MRDAANKELLKKHKIGSVVNCAAGEEANHFEAEVVIARTFENFIICFQLRYLELPLGDTADEDIAAYFEESYVFIGEDLSSSSSDEHCLSLNTRAL